MDRERFTRAAGGTLVAAFLIAGAAVGADALSHAAPQSPALVNDANRVVTETGARGDALDLETLEPSEAPEASETAEPAETAEPSEQPEKPEATEKPKATSEPNEDPAGEPGDDDNGQGDDQGAQGGDSGHQDKGGHGDDGSGGGDDGSDAATPQG